MDRNKESMAGSKTKKNGNRKITLTVSIRQSVLLFLLYPVLFAGKCFRMFHGAFHIGFLSPVIGESDVVQLEFAVSDVESVGGKGAEGGFYRYIIEVQLFSSVVESALYF